MSDKIEIKNIDNDGNEFVLIYSNSFSLLNRNDSVTVKLPKEFFNWIIKLIFKDDSLKNKFAGETKIEGQVIQYTFFNWNSDTYVENVEAHKIYNNDKTVDLRVKVRTISTNDKNFRLVILTIWQKL